MEDFGDEAGEGGYYGYFGVGVEEVEDSTGGDLEVCMLGLWREKGERGGVYVSATDDEDSFVADLPGDEEGSAGLDGGEFGCGHWVSGIGEVVISLGIRYKYPEILLRLKQTAGWKRR